MSGFKLFKDNQYTVYAELKGSTGAVNALTFSKDGRYLLSGGDDERIRIWNLKTLKCEQSLQSDKWGQITTLTWATVDPPIDGPYVSICVGTGRGAVALCPMSSITTLPFLPKNTVTAFPFELNDAVETQAYDPSNQRLAVGSSSGQIKMFSVDRCAKLTTVWMTTISNARPRSISFCGRNQTLLIHGLETGEMSLRDVQNANVLWTKNLSSGIGNASLSPDESMLLVDALASTGRVDVYRFPEDTPFTSLPSTESQRHSVRQCHFAEGGKVAVCGAKNNKVHVFDIATWACMQSLSSPKEAEMIQALAVARDGRRHLIAGGSTNKSPTIYVWAKEDPDNLKDCPEVVSQFSSHTALNRQAAINAGMFFALIVMTYPTWLTHFWKFVAGLSFILAKIANLLAQFSDEAAPKV